MRIESQARLHPTHWEKLTHGCKECLMSFWLGSFLQTDKENHGDFLVKVEPNPAFKHESDTENIVDRIRNDETNGSYQ